MRAASSVRSRSPIGIFFRAARSFRQQAAEVGHRQAWL
jgi:hypothetical protein